MADVYKFKIKINNLKDIIWRDIEITSVSSVAKLGYSILAAFECTAGHPFCIQYNENRYEIVFMDYGFDMEEVVDPIKTKLSAIKLLIGDTMTMEYDYGAGWEFSIELISITEMKRGAGNHYPYVTDGRGKGIIEDISPYELLEIIEKIDETGEIPKIYDYITEKEKDWDYRKFDMEFCNLFFKELVLKKQYAYELFK